jgi:hypothetical protein
MNVCRATKANGEPCTLAATGSQGFCWAHDPANREKRRKTASKAAKSKPNRELVVIKAQLQSVIDGVLSGAIDRNVGSVAFQGYRTLLQAVSTELAVREQVELVERMEALEEAIRSQKKGWYGGA